MLYWNGEYPWFSSGETSNDYVVKTIKTITKAGIQNSSTRLAKTNSTVIASAGVGLTRGQTSFLLIDTYVNQSVIVLEPKDEFSFFLYTNLKGRYDEIRNLSDLDSIRGSLTTKTVAQMPIPYITKESISNFNNLCSASITIIKHNLHEMQELAPARKHLAGTAPHMLIDLDDHTVPFKDRYKRTRRHEAMLWMYPPCKSLGTYNIAVIIGDRLKIGAYLLSSDSLGQISGDRLIPHKLSTYLIIVECDVYVILILYS